MVVGRQSVCDGILTPLQARGEEKSQGCRLLRAQEGAHQEALRRQEKCQRRLQGLAAARAVRLLDFATWYGGSEDEGHVYGEAGQGCDVLIANVYGQNAYRVARVCVA